MKRQKEILELGNNFAANQVLKKIWAKILLDAKESPKSILITSSLFGEGKTVVALNMAMSLAAEGNHKVLLIEGNLRNRKIQHRFNLPSLYGLTDFLLNSTSLHKAIQNSTVPNLFIMGAGSDGSEFLPLAQLGNVRSLLEQSKKEYDFIIFDALPVLESHEPNFLFKQFDGTILIIQANRTTRTDVEKAKKEIIESGGRILGVILNRKNQYVPKIVYRKFFGNDE